MVLQSSHHRKFAQHIAAPGNERSHLSLDANDINDAIQNQSNSVVRENHAL